MSHKKYVLALDEGTTSVRAVLFDNRANVVYTAQHEFSQIYPQPGWVEQNAVEIYAAQYAVMTECIAGSGISPGEIAGIGITNQRETTVVWNKQTGKPIYHAIVWQCRRTADICRQLKKDGKEEYIRRTTGLIPDAYFSGTKIKWILDHVESARPMAENGDLLFGTIDTWLLWKLTEGKVHATDVTNASRTMLFDIHKGVWDDQILNWLEIPAAMLPEVKSSSEIFGTVNVMGAEIPICGIAGDQQSALFGQGCFTEGTAKNTYGTGCFLLEHTGNYPIVSKNGLITTMAATEKDNPFEYALEGSVFVGGAVIQWLRDGLGLIREYRDSEYFAGKVSDTGGVYIVPAFAGLGAPYWNMNVRGTITGLTRGTRAEHLIRAAVESVAFQTEDLLAAMAADSGKKITCLRVDGGGSANDLMMQLQADYSGIEVIRSANQEATAAGAAFLAGLAVGFFPDRQTILELCKNGDHFSSSIDPETRKTKLEGWHLAIAAAQATVKE